MTIHAALSLMPEGDFLKASYPLFEDGQVDALEWSFDMGFERQLPSWAQQLIEFFSKQGKLYGHGVTFSLLSAKTDRHHMQWQAHFAQEIRQHSYVHVSEHFGFMRAGKFDFSAPMPVPYTAESVAIGQKRLLELAEICSPIPIGLENLALAFGEVDLAQQGMFLEDLLRPVSGFLLLDLHNIYCQMHNFKKSLKEVLHTYPLHRVRELHISGGSWSRSASSGSEHNLVRRDTHDDSVPPEVFDLLTPTLQLCPNVEVIVMERMGQTITDVVAERQYRGDFQRLKQIIADFNSEGRVPAKSIEAAVPGQFAKIQANDDILLAQFQDVLLDLLASPASSRQIIDRLKGNPNLTQFGSYINSFDEGMISVGKDLLAKWGSVF